MARDLTFAQAMTALRKAQRQVEHAHWVERWITYVEKQSDFEKAVQNGEIIAKAYPGIVGTWAYDRWCRNNHAAIQAIYDAREAARHG